MFICDWMSRADIAIITFMMPDGTIRYLPLKSLSLPKIEGVGKNGPIYSGTYFTEADITEEEAKVIFNKIVNKDLTTETKETSVTDLTDNDRILYENKITELDNKVNQLLEKLGKKEIERLGIEKDYNRILNKYEKVMRIVEKFEDFFEVQENSLGMGVELKNIYD